MSEGKRIKRATYTNAARQSNSAHMTKERIFLEQVASLERKEKEIETRLRELFDVFLHDDENLLSKEFKNQLRNMQTIHSEIVAFKAKIEYHQQAQMSTTEKKEEAEQTE